MEKNYPTALPDFHLTKTHRKLLKYAKKRIKEGNNEHVCNAIQHGSNFPDESGLKRAGVELVALDLKKFIRRAIEKKVYFDAWQRRNGIYRTPDQSRADRIKWIKYILDNAPRHEE